MKPTATKDKYQDSDAIAVDKNGAFRVKMASLQKHGDNHEK